MEPVWLMPKSAHKTIQIMPTKDATTPRQPDQEELPKNRKIDDSHLHEEEELPKITTIRECKPSTVEKTKPVSDITENLQVGIPSIFSSFYISQNYGQRIDF